MDKRYVKLIADNMPCQIPRKLKNATKICFTILVLGLFLVLNKNYGVYGFGLGIAASIGLIVTGYLSIKHRRTEASEFVKNYEKTGFLPPWPEELKNESPQPNN